MIEAMKQALDVLESERDKYLEWGHGDGAPEDVYEAITALQTAIAEAEKQEPVAYINVEQRKLEWAKYTSWNTPTVVNLPKIPLYTAPQPQREWVGLTEDDRNEILIDAAKHNWDDRLIVKQMETKLKEKT